MLVLVSQLHECMSTCSSCYSRRIAKTARQFSFRQKGQFAGMLT